MLASPPRHRGFNLPDLFVGPIDLRFADMIRNPRGQYALQELEWIAGWGFDFVRLPLSYRWWAGDDPMTIDDAAFEPIDRVVDAAGRLGLHVSLNLHHAPGYCINPPPVPERYSLWTDPAASAAFNFHWASIARRYRSVSGRVLDFNLLNEPTGTDHATHARIMTAAVEAIRAISPDRPIVLDGLSAGNEPCPELLPLHATQSCRGYAPSELTHYLAWWAGTSYVPPAWPQPRADGSVFGREQLWAKYAPWRDLIAAGGSVICGELGAWNRTPHAVVLAWMDDLLQMFKQMNVGFALWNFRGSFGVLDSARSDVAYADWHGIPLDRELLALLQRS